MIVFEKDGNIFDSTLHALVCPVNTVGTMGNGLAEQFKLRYPGLDWMYRQACSKGLFRGTGFLVWNGNPTHKVVLMVTKQHWRNPSRLEWIEKGLQGLADHYEQHDIQSVAIPPVGCGQGKLPWKEVRSVIYRIFEDHPLSVGIYRPDSWA